MKLALFTDTYDEINGVGNTFRYLTDYCEKNNQRIDVYTHSTGEDTIEERGSVRILRYKPVIPFEYYKGLVFDVKLLRERVNKEAKKQKYDLIHTASPGSMGFNALRLARRQKIPLVGSYHTSIPEYANARFQKHSKRIGNMAEDMAWPLMKAYYDRCRAVFVPSYSVKEQLETKLDTEVKIFSRGIDTDRFDPAKRTEPAKTTALYVGRISIEKNLDQMANIFKGRDDVRLVMIGDGPYRKDLEKQLPDATFTGFMKGEPLCQEYASADIFIFPSTTDTFGNVVLEALSSGIPAVVTDKMGPKEIVTHEKTGFVASGWDDFRNKVNKLVSDSELRHEMGQNARQYALTQTWDAIFGRLFDDYRKALD